MKPETKERLPTILGILAGYASMCWDPTPTGVFDSTEAQIGVENALKEIEELEK